MRHRGYYEQQIPHPRQGSRVVQPVSSEAIPRLGGLHRREEPGGPRYDGHGIPTACAVLHLRSAWTSRPAAVDRRQGDRVLSRVLLSIRITYRTSSPNSERGNMLMDVEGSSIILETRVKAAHKINLERMNCYAR